MDEDFKNALVYGFLGALGFMLLNTSSPDIVLTATWIGAFLIAWGIAALIFIVLEKASSDKKHQAEITIVLALIITGSVIASMDIIKVAGAVLMSIALGRAIASLSSFFSELF